MGEKTKIQNKEMLLYSAEKAVDEVCRLKNEEVPDEEAYFRIGTAIHWLVDYIERCEKARIEFEPQIKEMTSGLKFVNNSLKHKPGFKRADIDERYSFPIQFKMKYGLRYDFANLDDLYDAREKDEFKNYKEKLEGRDIIIFLSALLNTLKNYYDDL